MMDAHNPFLLPAQPMPLAEREAVYHAMLTRRDTRGEFLPDPVPDDVLSRVLIAAHHAPSVGFMQPWSFVLVKSAQVRAKVHAAFADAHAEAAQMFDADKREVYSALKLEGIMEAPVNICVTCDRDRAGPVVIGRTHIRSMDIYSSVCAVQNLWLAARAEGLGLGWVSIFDNARVQEILNIPKGILPVAYLCLGWVKGYHPRPELESAGWRQRLPLDSLLHFEGWGSQDDDSGLKARIREDQEAVNLGLFRAG